MRFAAAFAVAAAALAPSAAQSGPTLILYECGIAPQFQSWKQTPNKTKLYLGDLSSSATCIDIEGFQTAPGATVYTWPCGQDGGDFPASFRKDAGGPDRFITPSYPSATRLPSYLM